MTNKNLSTLKPILLDTHIAVWLSDASPQLKPTTLSMIESGFYTGQLCISTISAWEVGLLVSKNRLDLGQPPLAWFETFVKQFNISVLEITAEIAINSSFLTGKVQADPADRIILATALAHSATLVSADKEIILYAKQGFIHIVGNK